MSFLEHLDALPVARLLDRANNATASDVENVLFHGVRSLEDFSCLLSGAARDRLEEIAHQAHALTLQRFGRTIQLYAPLYISNECANYCAYCGFSRGNDIVRRTLGVEEVCAEAEILRAEGFRHLLLVSGENLKHVTVDYLESAVRALRQKFASLSIEVGALEEDDYRRMVSSGVDGLVIYQETYDRQLYALHHPKGRKHDFDWRLDTPERGARALMRRVGIGILLGLGDWKRDALCLAAHARYLMTRYWQTTLTVSVPRLRPAAGGFVPKAQISDKDFVRLICALRLALPDAGIVLSTREHPALRDGLVKLGVTQMSAGSRTEPGGYSRPWESEAQFEVEDRRTPREIAAMVARQGYEPVWKDWDEALCG